MGASLKTLAMTRCDDGFVHAFKGETTKTAECGYVTISVRIPDPDDFVCEMCTKHLLALVGATKAHLPS